MDPVFRSETEAIVAGQGQQDNKQHVMIKQIFKQAQSPETNLPLSLMQYCYDKSPFHIRVLSYYTEPNTFTIISEKTPSGSLLKNLERRPLPPSLTFLQQHPDVLLCAVVTYLQSISTGIYPICLCPSTIHIIESSRSFQFLFDDLALQALTDELPKFAYSLFLYVFTFTFRSYLAPEAIETGEFVQLPFI